MLKRIILILFISLLVCLPFIQTPAQQVERNTEEQPIPQKVNASVVFNEIETGISHSSVKEISNKLSAQTYLNLMDGVSGYYSTNQAYYVLEKFFEEYQIISFNFKSIISNESTPYATGEYTYMQRGKRGVARVYIALKKVSHNWKITQITIN